MLEWKEKHKESIDKRYYKDVLVTENWYKGNDQFREPLIIFKIYLSYSHNYFENYLNILESIK
jgi:hypothetical protein